MKLFLLTILSTLLLAQNPKIYAKLGDVIYNNASKIESMQEINEFRRYMQRIESYTTEVTKLKEYGFKIEQGAKGFESKKYLEGLRDLEDTNNFFMREIDATFQMALRENNVELFTQMLSSDMVSIEKYEGKILSFYDKNSEHIAPNDTIDTLLAKRAAEQKAIQEQQAQKKRTAIKKESELSRIERLRRNDKLKEEALEKKLQKELEEERARILEEQMRALSR